MNKEEVFIDLRKCSEEQRNHIFSLLPTDKITAQIYYMIRNSDWEVLQVDNKISIKEITELCNEYNRSGFKQKIL